MIELLILIFGAVGVGFFLIFLLALSDKNRKANTPQEEPTLSLAQFKKACIEVVENMKLEVLEISESPETKDKSEKTLDMIAKNITPIVGGTFLVRCVYRDASEPINAAEIIEFSNTVLQERLSKGLFLTTGKFTDEIPSIGELAPIEFIDGDALKKLMDEYKIIFRN